jgi:hypothetical protein
MLRDIPIVKGDVCGREGDALWNGHKEIFISLLRAG